MRLAPAETQPDSISCVPTSTKMGVNQATAGVKDPSVYGLRAAVGDFSGGMSYIEMTEATQDAAHVPSWAKYDVQPTDAKAIVEAGHPTVWSIDTNVTAPYPDVRTYTFRGGHSIHVVADGFTEFIPDGDVCSCEKHIKTRHGEYTYKDPGTSKGYHRISAELLHKAAKVRAGYADGGVNILVLPDALHVKKRGKRFGYIRSRPDGTSSSRGPIVIGRTYSVFRPVRGVRYRMANGHYSNGWWELEDDKGYVRADKLSVANV